MQSIAEADMKDTSGRSSGAAGDDRRPVLLSPAVVQVQLGALLECAECDDRKGGGRDELACHRTRAWKLDLARR